MTAPKTDEQLAREIADGINPFGIGIITGARSGIVKGRELERARLLSLIDKEERLVGDVVDWKHIRDVLNGKGQAK